MNDDTINPNDSSGPLTSPVSRRNFLVVGGVGAAAVAAAPFIGSSVAGALPHAVPAKKKKKANSAVAADLKTAAFAASLEVLAVGTYKAALAAATSNALGPVPPAGANFVQTAITQHQAQLDKWNQVLTGAGKPPVTTPDPKLKATVDQSFAQVKDFGGAAKLARELESIAAATYLKAIPELNSADAIGLAGSIQIIDMQHVAILNYVLGEYPVPDVFAKTDKAATP